jgi:hypothetical protein
VNEKFCIVERDVISGCTPRWIFPSKVSTENQSVELFLIVLNQSKELEMGIDRK